MMTLSKPIDEDKRRRRLDRLTRVLRESQHLTDAPEASFGLDRRDPPAVQLCEGVELVPLGWVDVDRLEVVVSETGRLYDDLWRRLPRAWSVIDIESGDPLELWVDCPDCEEGVQKGPCSRCGGNGCRDCIGGVAACGCDRCDGRGELPAGEVQ